MVRLQSPPTPRLAHPAAGPESSYVHWKLKKGQVRRARKVTLQRHCWPRKKGHGLRKGKKETLELWALVSLLGPDGL